jgi:hypothetical protein
MIKNKKINGAGVILAMFTISVLAYGLYVLSASGGVKFVTTPAATSSVVTPYIPIEISLDGWNSFSAKENQFKRDVTFLYPKELMTTGGGGGDSFFSITFDDINKNSLAWTTPFTGSSTVLTLRGAVLLMHVSTIYPEYPESKLLYDSLSFYPFVEVYKKSISLDSKTGTIIKRELALPTGEKRTEYWAIFKNIDGTAYEFMMRGDIYTNSEEVFAKVLKTLKWGVKPVD